MAGGTVYRTAVVEEICDRAHEQGIHVHLDGAQGIQRGDLLERARGGDDEEIRLRAVLPEQGARRAGRIDDRRQPRLHRALPADPQDARRRHAPGGRARGGRAGRARGGPEAAAGSITTTRRCSRGELARMPGIALDPSKVQTNIVIFSVKPSGLSSADFLAQIAARGVLAVPVDADRVRMVTHLDVSRSDIEKAAEIVAQALAVRDHTPRKPIRIPACGGSSRSSAPSSSAAASAGRRSSPDLALILGGLAERTQQYYDRFISIICTETVHKQDLRSNLAPVGRPRTTVYELSVSRDSSGEGRRHVPRRANAAIGERAPRAKESGSRVHGSENRHARAAGVSARAQPAAIPVYPRRRGWRPSRHASDRLHRDAAGARAHHVGRQLLRGRRRRAQGARLVRSETATTCCRVDMRLSKPFLVPLPEGSFGVRPAIRVEKSEMTPPLLDVSIFSNPTRP